MSYLDDASLVVIPSGYKDQTIFAVKPTDGSGDLTFSRASSATRVASNGLIEKVRTNTILYSQAFDNNAAWLASANGTGIAPVITANNATAPDGTMTADTIVFNSGAGTTTGDSSVVYQAITANGLYTASFYARVTSGTGQLVFRSVAGSTYTTANLTTTWQRFSAAETGSSGFFEIGIRRGLSNEPINASVTVQMWGAQLEVGDIATDYIATTSAAVSVGPVSGLPRLDYLNSTCPRLLLEPQRSNLVTYSEQFDNASWTKSNATITANTSVSPDGYTSADTYTATGGANFVSAGATSSGSNSITYSVFAKAGSQNVFRIREAFYFGTSAIFNLSNGTVTSGAGTITDYGNGWYRCTLTQAYGVAQTNVSVIFDTTASSGSFYIWGAQFEVGAYATSYIPTLGTSVTRVADAASKTGISSLIGQTEGTLFAEIYPEEFVNGSYIGISDGANIANRIIFGFEGGSANSGTFQVYGASGLTGSGTYTRGQRMKVAIGYKSGSSALYVNGNLVNSVTSTFTATFTKFGFDSYAGTQNFVGKCSPVLISKTRLTNAQLAELTTL